MTGWLLFAGGDILLCLGSSGFAGGASTLAASLRVAEILRTERTINRGKGAALRTLHVLTSAWIA
ncbi:MAG: hypothetical protein KA419_13745 [Acidobacteria bacterium]|nr:hypothetical protein [Acidobacteriota bacterium]